jgi:IS30 family transposase
VDETGSLSLKDQLAIRPFIAVLSSIFLIHRIVGSGQRGLARHGKSRYGKGYEERGGKIDFHPVLDQRPLDAKERCTIGHREADTVIGKFGSDCLIILVDRQTRFLMAAQATRKLRNA